ncbi:MAG TPA: Rne/Rng family ribonuclease [Rhabdochlamydiaceae bacterium]|nr:Rne/Rng family ribonuclease [Rhabdochlamydiaceae bacterium]
MQEILLNIESKEIRCAYLRHGILHDLIIERKKNRQITGNVYRGRVTNILHNIQSAFIDINEGENGFIHISDIMENAQKFQEMFEMDFDWDHDFRSPSKSAEEADITKLLRIDQPVLVQVVKEPIGTKGARLTSNISIAGRYLVLLPNTPHRGVSRKIEDPGSRERLKKLIRAFEMPNDMGLICRTSSVNATAEMLIDEANDLLKIWQNIIENFHKSNKPTCLYQESDLIKRAVMTAIDKKYERVMVDDYATYQAIKKIHQRYATEHPLKIEMYRDKAPMFERFNVEKEIDRALRRKIWLPSGGYLFFDRTEAMHTVDVNSGRSTQQSANIDVEETLVQLNMEAAEEIARQLRLRNVGGLVICDFIDMRSRKNQRRVLDRLKEAMKEDSAKCTILGMSEFGLVEMTRQRSRESLSQTLNMNCPYCNGSGQIKTNESVAIEIERALKKLIQQKQQFGIKLVAHPLLDDYLNIEDKGYLTKFAEKLNAQLVFHTDDALHLNEYQFYSTTNGKKLEV